MATFLPYASCYGNKSAWPATGKNRSSWLSLLGAPPCLRHSHRRRGRSPAPELTVRQLTRLIRSLREIRCNGELQPAEGARSLAASRESPSCRSERGGHCISCLRCWMTQGKVMATQRMALDSTLAAWPVPLPRSGETRCPSEPR